MSATLNQHKTGVNQNKGSCTPEPECLLNSVRLRTMFFIVRREQDAVRIDATNIMGLTGTVLLHADKVKEFFNRLEQEESESHISGATGIVLSRNQATGRLHLKVIVEQSSATESEIAFGNRDLEKIQIMALRKVRPTIEKIFGEIWSEGIASKSTQARKED